MKIKHFSAEDRFIEAEDERGTIHRLSFGFVDDFVRFLVRAGYLRFEHPQVMFTHRWTGVGGEKLSNE